MFLLIKKCNVLWNVLSKKRRYLFFSCFFMFRAPKALMPETLDLCTYALIYASNQIATKTYT